MAKDRAAMSMLDAFCLANKITTPKLAEAAEVSRQHITRVRFARTDVRIRIAKKIALGASRVLGRKVQVAELFDLNFDFSARGANPSR
jgi:transcriptional regulator with XRE-family HTH domain